jgi:hypothetical protein
MGQNTLYKGHDLKTLVDAGKTTREIAEIIGGSVTQSGVRTALNRRGLTSVRKPPETIRKIAEEMRPSDAVQYLLGIIDEIVPGLSGDDHEIDDLDVNFTPQQRRILIYLVEAEGRTVTRRAIAETLYSTRSDDDYPDEKIIDVHISHIRKKLPETFGVIETAWGRGYRFVLAESLGE